MDAYCALWLVFLGPGGAWVDAPRGLRLEALAPGRSIITADSGRAFTLTNNYGDWQPEVVQGPGLKFVTGQSFKELPDSEINVNFK